MKKVIMAAIGIAAITATSAFAAEKYDCKAQVVQMTGEKSHSIKDIEHKAITMEAFRGKLVAFKTGQAQYTCTGSNDRIYGSILFSNGMAKRSEEAVSGKIPGHENMAELMKAGQPNAQVNKVTTSAK